MKLKLYKDEYMVLKLKEPLATKIDGIYFYAQTDDEYSLVCKVKIDINHISNFEKEYRLIKIEGILDFGLVGIISKISTILAQNNISIFVISTYNTDYFMVKESALQKTIGLLKSNDYEVISE
ncbi:ACT domain-containing protein [Mariniplasma anaerobium]|uniref:CASTOR ACT domain-containing protein n=1 Tax=Mariniplasma anaerobium TaxID=2735436 RepID=A0A7U9TJ12_9MOLU|nr:ACT domain-containing protein [Mariniplasma anaerobium]BCR35710.1 hypothetical protein MPAN_006030 [Mariniplasma anaerobium]